MLTKVSMRETFLEAARDVFETMVFMALEELPEDTGWKHADSFLGCITFKGSLEGCLSVSCGVPCARAIAANMRGLDDPEGLDERAVRDALCQTVNMIMSSLKSRIQADVGPLELSVPSVIQGRRLQTGLGEEACAAVADVSVERRYPAELALLYRQTVA
jgi:CheY-specific phosphatase CheX